MDNHDWSDPGFCKKYLDNQEADYHQHRLKLLRALLPKANAVVDFGCGDGSLLPSTDITSYVGFDISQVMVDETAKRWGKERAIQGGVEQLQTVKYADLVIAANVLCYLSPEEEDEFYKQAYRMLIPGGWLLVAHRNELFDVFALSDRTEAFFQKYLTKDKPKRNLPNFSHLNEYPTTANPFTFGHKLKKYGFTVIDEGYMHPNQNVPNPDRKPEDALKESWADTLNCPLENRWTLMFVCPSFATLAKKI